MSELKPKILAKDSRKEAWLAVNLSLLFPGMGQLYTGNLKRGCLLIVIQLFLYGMSGGFILSPRGNLILGSLILLFTICLSIWSIYDSYYCCQKLNLLRVKTQAKPAIDPWLAVLLSRVFPGLGHLYINKVWLGLLFFTLFIISLLVDLVPILLKSLIAYHVYFSSPNRYKTDRQYILIICIFSIITSIILTLGIYFVKIYICEPYLVPSDSMVPTLQPGDHVLVDKHTYHGERPHRGDVVAFLPTKTIEKQNLQEVFVKRIIGLPGEEVTLKQGNLYINSQRLDENYIQADWPHSSEPITVPSNCYLVLADNRSNSYDLNWGIIPQINIRGKVYKRFWPLPHMGTIQ